MMLLLAVVLNTTTHPLEFAASLLERQCCCCCSCCSFCGGRAYKASQLAFGPRSCCCSQPPFSPTPLLSLSLSLPPKGGRTTKTKKKQSETAPPEFKYVPALCALRSQQAVNNLMYELVPLVVWPTKPASSVLCCLLSCWDMLITPYIVPTSETARQEQCVRHLYLVDPASQRQS